MINSIQHPDEKTVIREVRDSDHGSIIAIFNYYAATSYAAYPDIPVNERFFAFLQEGAFAFYVLECGSNVVGFGLMKPLLPFPAFMTTGVLTHFIPPEYTRMHLGRKLLDRLTADAKKMGITSLVANMASKKQIKYTGFICKRVLPKWAGCKMQGVNSVNHSIWSGCRKWYNVFLRHFEGFCILSSGK